MLSFHVHVFTIYYVKAFDSKLDSEWFSMSFADKILMLSVVIILV